MCIGVIKNQGNKQPYMIQKQPINRVTTLTHFDRDLLYSKSIGHIILPIPEGVDMPFRPVQPEKISSAVVHQNRAINIARYPKAKRTPTIRTRTCRPHGCITAIPSRRNWIPAEFWLIDHTCRSRNICCRCTWLSVFTGTHKTFSSTQRCSI